ncbi:hypothetical protein J6590_041918 [Homalodisca vitripennis]|nr:hypothetical protein J6590_041918 [Homalodisca vitripennis]
MSPHATDFRPSWDERFDHTTLHFLKGAAEEFRVPGSAKATVPVITDTCAVCLAREMCPSRRL